MTSYVTPKKSVAYKTFIGLVDQSNTKLLKANPTIATGDFKVSIDGAAFANLATLPSASPASGRAIMIDLSTSEMAGDNIIIQCVDAAGSEWCDLLLNIQTTARQIDDLAFPTVSGRSLDITTTGEAGIDWANVGAPTTTLALTGTTIAVTQKVDVDTIKTNPVVNGGTITFPTTATLASTTNITAATGIDVTKLLGTAWLTPGTAGTPDVNVKLWNALTTVALPLVPTVAGRTLDVSAGGEAGLDWANIGSPTTTVDLSGTTIKTTQKVDVDTIKTNPVVNGGTITFPTTATLASTTNITAGTITTTTNLTNAATAGDLTATMKTSVQTAADAAVTANASVAAIKTQTDKFVFTVANVVDANMLRTNGDATSAANVAKTTRAVGRCTVGAASTTTSIVTSACTPTGVDADQFKGRIITFDADTTTTGLRGQATDCTANTAAAAPVFTVTALTQAPVSGDTFSIT